MEEQPNQPAEPSEEELRAAYEEQLKRIRVDDVLVQTIVSLINLGGYKLQESDLEQVGQAIEGARAILPLVEEALGPDAGQIRTAMSQLQLAYAREVGAGDAPAAGEPPAADKPAEEATGPGPAQTSGRLWVPGQ
jgi:hypothetical protein